MQKTPMYRSSRTVLALMAVASSLPVTITIANAGEGGYGMSGLAQREMVRRQDAVTEGDILLNEGRAAYAKGDHQQAVDKYRKALDRLPDAPMVSDRRESYTAHLSDASVALSIHHRKVGKYAEARTLLEAVIAIDPENLDAKRELGYLDDPIRTNPALTYEHTQNVDKVRRGLYTAEGSYNLGKYNDAKREYEGVLRVDNFNTAARRGLERISTAKSDYYRAAYDHTRAELLSQVDAAWELAVPADAPSDLTGSGNPSGETGGTAYINEKLKRIIIPQIAFEDTTLEEAIDFLRLRAGELDTLELDPARKGVNFVIQKPKAGAAAPIDPNASPDAPAAVVADPGALRIDELRLKNIPLVQALKYICDKTKLRYKVDEYAVKLVPFSDTTAEIFTKKFQVQPDFLNSISGTDGGGAAAATADPFADKATATPSALGNRKSPKDALISQGVVFIDGTSATLNSSGTLLVTNTGDELDKIQSIVDNSTGTNKQVKITTKFVEISQENTDELGFDWIVNPFGVGNALFGDGKVFASGGSSGNQGGRKGSDFISPVNGTTIDGIPSSPSQGTTNGVTNGLRSGDGAVNRNNIDAILNNPGRNAQTANVAPGIAALTGLFSDGQVQLIMRGLAQKKGTDLMTAPSIMAKSTEKAKIEIVREFIYPTEYEPPELPNSVGSTGTSSLFGGGGSASGGFPVTPATPSAFNTRPTGVTLEIEPTFDASSFVINLQFVPEIIEFEGFINYGSPIQAPSTDALGNPVISVITENRIEMPVFSVRKIKTSLTIYDGYTVAVGGLMREDVQNVEDKVPILGDIPIIGRLFQSKSENRIKSNLIIFVSAQIIDPTGRPLRGPDAAQSVPVSTGGIDSGVLPPIDLPVGN